MRFCSFIPCFSVLFHIILFGILGSGCRGVQDHLLPVPVISVNPEFAVEATLEEACDSVFWISLQAPDSIVWASVEFAKSFGPYIVIPDIDRTMTYTVFDSVGNFVCQLNKRGKGPGEYIYPEGFSYSSETNELIINDRSKGFFFYTLPGLECSRTISEKDYKVSIQSIGKNLLVCREKQAEGGRVRGLELLDVDRMKYTSRNLAQWPASNELSYGNVFSEYIDGSVLYAHPFTITTVYQLTMDENIPLCQIDFGKNSIAEEFWKSDDAVKFNKAFSEGSYAAWVQDLIWGEDRFMFAYMFDDIETHHLASHHWKTGETKIYSVLRFWEGGPEVPEPAGVNKNFFMSLMYPEDLEEVNSETSGRWGQMYHQIRKSKKPALVLYRLK